MELSMEDLIWKIWELEKESFERQMLEEELRRRLEEHKFKGEDTLKQVASSPTARDYGVFSYDFKFDNARFEFQALDEKGNSQMRVRWQRAKEPQKTELGLEVIFVKIEKNKPHQELEIGFDNKSKSVLTIDGTRRSLIDLEDPKTALIVHEYHELFRDFLVGVVKDMQQYMRKSDEGTGEYSEMREANEEQKKVVSVVKSIACTCSGFGWIGLAICGPTCLGVIIAEAVDP